jgi:integrase
VPDIEFELVFRFASIKTQLIMLLARDAALRHAAILNFTAGNCNFENRTITGKTKGGSTYNVPMTQRLYERLLFACASAGDQREQLLAQYNVKTKRVGYTQISTLLWKAKRDAGVTRKWGLHDLRRTAARALYESTHDIRKVQRLMAHSGPMQTWWYLGNAGLELTHEEMETAGCGPKPKPDPSSPDSDQQSQPGFEPQRKIA